MPVDTTPAPVIVNADNPWPGLLPFGEKDQAFFKGRTNETEELLRLVLRERLSVLFGVSGLGKSSLLQAGLFPRLREHEVLPVYIRLDFSKNSRDLIDQVWDAVVGAAQQWNVEVPRRHDGETLWETLHRQNADFWNQRNRPVIPLLAFDQFEEIFTLGRNDPDRARATEAFVTQLADLAEGRPPATVEARLNVQPDEAENFAFERHYYKILLAVREDFLADLEGLRPRISAITLNRIRLRRMNGEAALLAVNQSPHLIDDPVAKVVVRFVAAAKEADAPLKNLEVEPALLSVVCSELNLKRQPGTKITSGLLEGSQDAILSDFYERGFAGVPSEVRDFLEESLLTKKGFRDSVALENALLAPGVTREFIDLLVKRRLIRIEDRGGERIELIHDLLTGVARASRDVRQAQREQLAAKIREESARKAAEERERQRRVVERARLYRWLAVMFLVAALVAVAAGFYIYQLGREAERRRAEAVTASAEADRRRAEADAARTEAVLQAALAAKAADLARSARNLAQTERDRATQAAILAQELQARADVAREDAEKKSQEAREAKLKSDENAELAVRRGDEAEKQTKLADEARKKEQEQREQVTKNLAQSHVLEAGRRIAIDRNAEALAYVALALQEDPASLAAASLAFDLLLRGAFRSNLDPLPSGAQPPLTHVPIPQPERVLSARFSPDGARIVTALWDGVTRVLDGTEDGSKISLPKHRALVNTAAFSPDSRSSLIVTASQDTTAKICDAATGRLLHELAHKRPVTSASFSPRGDRIVTTSWDNTAVVWNPSTGKPLFAPLEHPGPVTSASFSPDGERLVTSSWDRRARVWHVSSGRLLHEFELKAQVNSAAFSPNGRRIVTASDDMTAQVWELSQRPGEPSRPLGAPLRHAAAVNGAEFSPDGRRVVTASDDNTARIWESETGTPISMPLRHKSRVSTAAFSPDGLRVVTASYDSTVQVWEVRFATDDCILLGKFAEAISGFQASRLPDLVPVPDREKLLAELRDLAGRSSPGRGRHSVVHSLVLLAPEIELLDVLVSIVGEGARLTLAGLAVGAICAAVFCSIVGNLLYGVNDPLTYCGAAVLLAVVALIASERSTRFPRPRPGLNQRKIWKALCRIGSVAAVPLPKSLE